VALDDVTFTVPDGANRGFVGPNGAGKTTAMRIALGVLQADAGEVRWRGRGIDALARRRFGYMPEERGLYPKMKVHEQLVYLARLHGLHGPTPRGAPTRSSRSWEWRRVATTAWRRSRWATSSACSSPRRSLHEPDALVLDEPFSGLDPVGVDVLSGVCGARPTTTGFPWSSPVHQLELIERICDAVVLIDQADRCAGTIDELRASARGAVPVEVRLRLATGTSPIPGVTWEAMSMAA